MLPWESNKLYDIGEVVHHANVTYEAKSSSWGKEPPSAEWIVQRYKQVSNYDPKAVYSAGSIVQVDGAHYKSKTPVWGNKPPSDKWQEFKPEPVIVVKAASPVKATVPVPKPAEPEIIIKEVIKEVQVPVEVIVEKIVKEIVRPAISSFWID